MAGSIAVVVAHPLALILAHSVKKALQASKPRKSVNNPARLVQPIVAGKVRKNPMMVPAPSAVVMTAAVAAG